jgi:thiamine-phosphate pyrophosphorylase
MDERLVGWARAVKARRRTGQPPVLWLFTDAARLPDPVAAVQALPRGIGGVVLRDDTLPGRAALGRRIAALCRARRLALAVAGDWRLAAALHAGLHLRGGRRPHGAPRWLRAATGSAHGTSELVRAARNRVPLTFLSPAFPTGSHPGAPALGPVRWGALARRCGGAAALGGVDGRAIGRLPARFCRAAGAITALK